MSDNDGMNGSRKLQLWVRYARRRHPMTGRRVKHLRWRTVTIAGSGESFRRIHRLGAWDADVFTGWEWPG